MDDDRVDHVDRDIRVLDAATAIESENRRKANENGNEIENAIGISNAIEVWIGEMFVSVVIHPEEDASDSFCCSFQSLRRNRRQFFLAASPSTTNCNWKSLISRHRLFPFLFSAKAISKFSFVTFQRAKATDDRDDPFDRETAIENVSSAMAIAIEAMSTVAAFLVLDDPPTSIDSSRI